MKITIILTIIQIVCFVAHAQIIPSTYFYTGKLLCDTEMVTLFDGSTITRNSSATGYTFPFTWKKSQSAFVNSSFYLMGWKIQNTAKWLSYDASLNSVSSAGATLYYNPSTYSQILQIQFGLILLKPEPGIVKMIYCVHNSILGNGVTSETILLPVGTTFGSDTTVYKTALVISSFNMPYAGPHYWAETLSLSSGPIVSNTSSQSITMTTHYQTITKVTFTYIMMDLSSINPLPLIFFETIYNHWNGPIIKIPQQFGFKDNYNCIVGVTDISSSWLDGLHGITLTPSDSPDLNMAYNLTVIQIWSFYYTLLCTGGQCSNGTQVKPAVSLYQCNPCSSYMTQCSTCSAYNICTSCDSFFTVAQPTNNSCVACPVNCLNCTKIGLNLTCQICITNYYSSGSVCSPCLSECSTCNTSTSCLTCYFGWPVVGGCTNITFCQQVIPGSLLLNRCSKCTTPWIVGVGLCLNTSGCTTASYVWVGAGYLSSCTHCNATAHFDLLAVNDTCLCTVGYTIDKTTLEKCVQCPLNCKICEQSGGVGICKKCSNNYTLFEPLNISCIVVPANCINFTIISGYASCDACDIGYFLKVLNPIIPFLKVCEPCLIDCISCNSNLTCETCKYGGIAVLGGCTQIPFCLEVKRNNLNPAKCIDCSSAHNHQLLFGLCVNITGCLVPHLTGNNVICLSCNSAKNFKSVPLNNSCICSDGFSIDLTTSSCLQICGDGRLSNLQCDDGNNEDGDGCSSDCKVQDKFACIQGDIKTPSRCIYLFFDIKIKLKNINKVFMQNRGIFTFQILPHLSLYKRIDFSKIYTISTPRLQNVTSINFINNQIIIEVDYQEDLQTFPATLQLILPKRHFLQKKVNIDFDMISDDVKLVIISDKQKLLLFMKLQEIITIATLCVFALGSLSHKMIGLETLVPIQMVYLTHLLNGDVTPIYKMLSFFANSAFNLLHSENHLSNIATGNPATFSEENERVSMWAMLLLTFTAWAVFCVIVAIRLLRSKADERAKVTNEDFRKQRIFGVLSEIGYSSFIFPFLMGTFCVYWPLSVVYEHGNVTLRSASLRIGGLQAISLALVFFYEWKEVLLDELGQRQGFFKLKRCSRRYVPLFLTYLFVVTVSFCLGFIRIIAAEFFLTAIVTLALVAFVVYRPYDDFIHNLGIVYNNSVIVAFMWWNLARNLFPSLELEQEKNEETAILAIIGAISVCLVLAAVRVVYNFHSLLSDGPCFELKSSTHQQKKVPKNVIRESGECNSRQKLLPYHKQYLIKCGLQGQTDSGNFPTPVNYFQKNWQQPTKFSSKFQNTKQQLRNRLLRLETSK